jgi:hypothetical protein
MSKTAAVLVSFAAACGGLPSSDTPDAAPASGEPHAYASTSIVIDPMRILPLNLDGDSENRPDDDLNELLQAVDEAGFPILKQFQSSPTTIDFTVDSDGTGTDPWVQVSADGGDPCWGSLKNGHVSARGCTIPLHVVVGDQAPLDVTLVGARLEIDLDPCGGELGAGLPVAAVTSALEPWMAGIFDERIGLRCDKDDHCTANDACRTDETACDDGAKTLRDVFDRSEIGCASTDCASDGHITAAEVADCGFVEALLAPDVQLTDAAGTYGPVPLTDPSVVPNDISFAMAITCQPQ